MGSPFARLRLELSDEAVYPLGPARTLVVLGGAYLAGFVASINQTVTATALPKIIADLGGVGHYSWAFTAYILASVVTIPIFGKLSDLYGRRLVFVAAILLFSAGSVIAGAAPSMDALVLGRVVQGLGAGGLGPLALAVMGDVIAPRARGKWQVLNGAVLASSAVCGPLLGGWTTDNLSWRFAFLASLPIAALAVSVIWLGFAGFDERRPGTLDWRGAILLAIGGTSGLFALSAGGVDFGWGSPPIAVALVVTIVATGMLLRWERRVDEPILPLALVRTRTIGLATVALAAVGGSMLGAITYVPLLVQSVLGHTATRSATLLIPLTLFWIAASIVAGRIVAHTGRPRLVLLVGPAFSASGFALLATAGGNTSAVGLLRDVALVGTGLGLIQQTLLVLVQNAAPPGQLGAATASAEFSRWFGALAGIAVMGSVLATHVARASGSSPTSGVSAGLHGAFVVGIALAAIALAAAVLLPDVQLRDSFEDPTPPVEAARQTSAAPEAASPQFRRVGLD
jgi:EmrB/QacA subfamily drug resistance transporter